MYNIFKSISVYNCMRTNVKKCESIKEILLATFLEETVTEDVLSFNNYNFSLHVLTFFNVISLIN